MVAVAMRHAGGRQWPMTREAWTELDRRLEELRAETLANDGFVTGRLDGERDAPTFIPNVLGQQSFRQFNTLRQVLQQAAIDDTPGVAVIGRTITVQEADGSSATYQLVIPGAGNGALGMVAADAPVGRALLGRRVGDTASISAPAGTWTMTIVSIA